MLMWQAGGEWLRGAPAAQGGAGVPEYPAVAQCPPPLWQGAQWQRAASIAAHQVLHHHLQVRQKHTHMPPQTPLHMPIHVDTQIFTWTLAFK